MSEIFRGYKIFGKRRNQNINGGMKPTKFTTKSGYRFHIGNVKNRNSETVAMQLCIPYHRHSGRCRIFMTHKVASSQSWVIGRTISIGMPGAKVNLSHLLKYTSMATCLFTVVTPHIGDPLSLTTFNAKIGDPTRANSGPTLIVFFSLDGCMALCLHSPGGRPSVSTN